jgi:hypothetical protein
MFGLPNEASFASLIEQRSADFYSRPCETFSAARGGDRANFALSTAGAA